MTAATQRRGFRELATIAVPPAAVLEPQAPPAAHFHILKLEPNTVVWIGSCTQGRGSAIYKMYRNRSAASWCREHAFRFRVEREFQSLSALVRYGIRCSVPDFWTFGRDADHGRFEILCMCVIPEATPMNELVAAGRAREIDFSELYQLVRRMHQKGFYHGRLDLRNVLLGHDESGNPRSHIIDTPQAIEFPHDITGTKMAWMDLRQLTRDIKVRVGQEHCRPLLARYGMDEAGISAMMRDLAGRGRPLLQRNLLRFGFGLRAQVAALLARTPSPTSPRI